ncbi:hypothetical protein pEaSNUABM54_00247 [Erwinia phage pEa_SNUABM_54]|nr:hypothetical protein pEaSNUABM54_00247 [Erwinia phage pEa_SNUABM_54]
MAKRNKTKTAPVEGKQANDQMLGRLNSDRETAAAKEPTLNFGSFPGESRSAAGSLLPTPKPGEPVLTETISPQEARAEMAALFGESETNQDLSTDNIELLDEQLKAKGTTLSELLAEPTKATIGEVVTALGDEEQPADVFNPGEGRLVLVQYDPVRITAEAVEALIRPKYEPIGAGIVRMTIMATRSDVRDARIEAIKEWDVIVLIIPALSVTHAHQFYPLAAEADILLVVNELGYETHKFRGVLNFNKAPQAF